MTITPWTTFIIHGTVVVMKTFRLGPDSGEGLERSYAFGMVGYWYEIEISALKLKL